MQTFLLSGPRLYHAVGRCCHVNGFCHRFCRDDRNVGSVLASCPAQPRWDFLKRRDFGLQVCSVVGKLSMRACLPRPGHRALATCVASALRDEMLAAKHEPNLARDLVAAMPTGHPVSSLKNDKIHQWRHSCITWHDVRTLVRIWRCASTMCCTLLPGPESEHKVQQGHIQKTWCMLLRCECCKCGLAS